MIFLDIEIIHLTFSQKSNVIRIAVILLYSLLKSLVYKRLLFMTKFL